MRVTITQTDVGEWTGEHDRPSAAYARALVQAYPDPTIEPSDLRELWVAAITSWKKHECYTRLTYNNRAQSLFVTLEI
jgi:hypothetical protein